MRLTITYREQSTGVLKGTKQFFLVCNVQFGDEERAIIQERGLYEESIDAPAATPPPTRSGDFGAMVLRFAGIICMPLGFLASCVAGLAHSDASSAWFFLFLAGIALFVVGKMKDRAANRREDNPAQHLTLRRLLTNPEFVVYAPALDVARMYEESVREELKRLADIIRANVAVPEANTYEL
jgi:hypothetical protein